MKLRNKKTGEIKSIREIISEAFLSNTLETLKNIDANWEEIEEPKGPLIKDEEIRKAVRAWAEVNYIHDVYFKDDGVTTFIGGDYEQISFNPWRQSGLEEGKLYTIEELCGSEE